MQISFTPEFAARLKSTMHKKIGLDHNPHGGGNTYELERATEQDMLLTSVGWANSYYASEKYNPGGDTYTDEWGVTWKKSEYSTRFGDGFYTEMIGHPLEKDEAVDSYQAPDPKRPELYRDTESMIRTFKDEYWIVGVTVTTIFETAWALRGLEKILIDFVTDHDLVKRILDIPFRHHLTAAKKLVRMGVDMIWIGDDVGTQTTMLISPECWRQFLKPLMSEFIATLKHVNQKVKIAYHSDGSIYPIIPGYPPL